MWDRRKKIVYIVVQQGGVISESVAVDNVWNYIESFRFEKTLKIIESKF